MTALNSHRKRIKRGNVDSFRATLLRGNEKEAAFGGLDQERSATLKNFIGGRSSPELKAGQLEVAGKGPPAILIRKLAVPPHVMSVA